MPEIAMQHPNTIAEAWAMYMEAQPDMPEKAQTLVRKIFYDGVAHGLSHWRETEGEPAKYDQWRNEYLAYRALIEQS